MGRAYEVRKASIQKEGAAKGKLYTTFAKEIYLVAKNNPEIESNLELKRIIDKAKKARIGQLFEKELDQLSETELIKLNEAQDNLSKLQKGVNSKLPHNGIPLVLAFLSI